MLVVDNVNFEKEFNLVVTNIRGRGIVNYELETTFNSSDGERVIRKKRPPRYLEIDMTLLGETKEELRESINKINQVLHVRDLKEKEIFFLDEPHLKYYGYPAESIDEEQIVSSTQITLVFFCSNPDKFGNEIKLRNSKKIYLQCNQDTPPYFTIYIDKVTNFVELSLDDEVLRVNYDFQKGDILEIDCERKKIFINKILNMNALDIEKADFFVLKPSENNININPNFDIDINFIERWL